MRYFLIVLLLACSANAQELEPHLTNAILRGQIQELAREQQREIDSLQANLADSRGTATALWDDLVVAKTEVGKIVDERDGWRNRAQLNDVTVQKQGKRILQLYIALGTLIFLNVAYIGLRLHPATAPFIP